MKHVFSIIALLVILNMVVGSVHAADENSATVEDRFFLVYQKSGKVSPFFASEVDSIVYSKFDVDSVEHTDWQSQVVFTPDSAYVFPIAEVDSVTFQMLPTVYQPDVVLLPPEWEKFVRQSAVESNDVLTLDKGIISIWTPHKGDVLFYNEVTEMFPYGYSGKVTDVVQTDNSYILSIGGDIGLDDIYKQIMHVAGYLTGYVEPIEEQNGQAPAARLKKLNAYANAPIIDDVSCIRLKNTFSIDSSLGGNFVSGVFSGKSEYSIDLFINSLVLKEPSKDWIMEFKFNPYISNKNQLSLGGSVGFEFNKYGDESPIFEQPFPLGESPFIAYARVGFYAALSGSVSAQLSMSKTFHFPTVVMSYKDGIWNCDNVTNKNSNKYNLDFGESIEFSGEVVAGPVVGLAISTPRVRKTIPFVEVGAVFRSGLYANGAISFSPSSISTMSAYDSLKDSEFNTGFRCGLSLYAQACLNEEIGSSIDLGWNVFDMPFGRLTIFPSFDDIDIDKNRETREIEVSVPINGCVILPQQVGFALYDDSEQLVERKFVDEVKGKETFNKNINATFSKLKPNAMYTIRPSIQIFDIPVDASPGAKVIFELNVTTKEAVKIEDSSATLIGSLDYPFDSGSMRVGFVYSITNNPTMNLSTAKWCEAKDPNGVFSFTLDGLEAATTYYYRACVIVDNEGYYGDMMQFTTLPKPEEGIDLGLSVNWATRNVGAASPEDVGGLYGWADPTGNNTSADVMNIAGKWDSPLYGGANPPSDISGTSLDIARQTWQGNWRMPSEAEISELVSDCTWEWSEENGTPGYTVTGPSGASIFLPITGYRFGNEIMDAGCGYYWSGSLNQSQPNNAYRIDFSSGDFDYTSYPRYAGHAVRPVIDRQ